MKYKNKFIICYNKNDDMERELIQCEAYRNHKSYDTIAEARKEFKVQNPDEGWEEGRYYILKIVEVIDVVEIPAKTIVKSVEG